MKRNAIFNFSIHAAAFILAAALAAAGWSQGTTGDDKSIPTSKVERLNRAPVSKDILSVKLPRPLETTLPNGIHLMILEDHRVPLVTVQFDVNGAGPMYEPAGQPGLAGAKGFVQDAAEFSRIGQHAVQPIAGDRAGVASVLLCFALAQLTPGPNLIIVALIGFHVAGVLGAVVAMLAMCGPTGVAAYFVGRASERFRSKIWHSAISHGLVPVTIGLIAASATVIATTADYSWRAGVVTAATAIICYFARINPIWVFIAAAGLGLVGVV